MSHVVEHVHNPLELLKGCYQLLKKGGYLWLETPNILSIGHKDFKENWLPLDPPRHLMLFNVDSLQKGLYEAGFSEVEVLPYRHLCETIYNQSMAISHEVAHYGENIPKANEKFISRTERLAKKDVKARELINLKAIRE